MTPRVVKFTVRPDDAKKTAVVLLPNVRIGDIHPNIGHAIDHARAVWEETGYQVLIVTSVNDGTHGKGSLHPLGCALDIRKWNLREEHRPKVVSLLVKRLGKEYDVILESTHIHVEWQPKETIG